MTRKDYILIARSLVKARPASYTASDPALDNLQWELDCQRIAEAFASDNDRFQAARFIDACKAPKDGG